MYCTDIIELIAYPNLTVLRVKYVIYLFFEGSTRHTSSKPTVTVICDVGKSFSSTVRFLVLHLATVRIPPRC